MTRLFIRFLLFVVVMSFFMLPGQGACEMEFYGLDQDSNFLYYDKNLSRELGDIVQVWQRKVFHSDNLFRIRQTLGEKYYKLIEKLTLYEIHCPTKSFQERAYAYYDSNERYVDGRYYDFVRDWKRIMPNTDMARLYLISCRSENKK